MDYTYTSVKLANFRWNTHIQLERWFHVVMAWEVIYGEGLERLLNEKERANPQQAIATIQRMIDQGFPEYYLIRLGCYRVSKPHLSLSEVIRYTSQVIKGSIAVMASEDLIDAGLQYMETVALDSLKYNLNN